MTRILLLVAALAVPAVLSAQDDPLRFYRIAVELYRLGQTGDSLRLARSWRIATVQSDGKRLFDDADRRLAPGMALLMTELGRRNSTAGGPEQFAVAEMLVRGFRGSPDLKAFQERWYAFMASTFTDELNLPGARTLIERGMRIVGESPHLLLMSGRVFEMSTYPHATCPDCRPDDDQAVFRNLTRAAEAYRRATALDPHSAEGHLRLGRVLQLLGDRGGARQELGEVERITTSAELLYLVALFRSDLNQEEGDVRAAAAEAERAVSIGPDYQSARIALAHLSDRLGQADRSRQIVDRLLRLPPAGDPWWEFRQPSQDIDSLEWMRNHIRQ